MLNQETAANLEAAQLFDSEKEEDEDFSSQTMQESKHGLENYLDQLEVDVVDKQ